MTNQQEITEALHDWPGKASDIPEYGINMLYGYNGVGQNLFMLWHVAWRHQAITWTDVNLSLMRPVCI